MQILKTTNLIVEDNKNHRNDDEFGKMKRKIFVLIFTLCMSGHSQVILDADGPGNTYNLITSVLAPGYNPIEVPDCNHPEFGYHIDEVFDMDLSTYVFRFHIHVAQDNDRCINFDRQRNEIKSYDQSPDNLLGVVGETVVYNWKFKLAAGFQTSPNFTHLHQLKSVGGSLESMPMYTLTARKSNPDRLELRYAETNTQVTLAQTDLDPFIGSWLEATETIKYGESGTYSLEIKRINDGIILFDYSNTNIVNWRLGAEFVRPKWGIYRSLINDQDLRDEVVLYANFNIEEIESLSIDEHDTNNKQFKLFPNPVKSLLHLLNLPPKSKSVQITSIDGRVVLEKSIKSQNQLTLDLSLFSSGNYFVIIKGGQSFHSKMIVIPNN
ncbi:T9SS type A sorting domain-containing protein [uncultured Winogradskyella sp.]|uniref:T9SS type A sorting domain-containing protein n=1 Tax=uncultured Winogradskyella sp. TaxID=395353 RepID=UPI0026364941|nr:T9SS type A sorting domain-containing protein [uncultured Winogradskyella sp.]